MNMEPPYSKREIDDKFGSLEKRLLDKEEGILPRIEAQTRKTNGRVNRLEQVAIVLSTITIVELATNAPALATLIAHLL